MHAADESMDRTTAFVGGFVTKISTAGGAEVQEKEKLIPPLGKRTKKKDDSGQMR